MEVQESNGQPSREAQDEVRECTTHLISLMKEEKEPIDKRRLQSMIDERMKLENNFRLLGKLIGAKEVRRENGAMKNY